MVLQLHGGDDPAQILKFFQLSTIELAVEAAELPRAPLAMTAHLHAQYTKDPKDGQRKPKTHVCLRFLMGNRDS